MRWRASEAVSRAGQEPGRPVGVVGAAFLGGALPAVPAIVQAIAAGALLTMLPDTIIPEAVQGEHGTAGVLVAIGLLLAFALSHGGSSQPKCRC